MIFAQYPFGDEAGFLIGPRRAVIAQEDVEIDPVGVGRAENLVEHPAELGLGLDSFIFIDDNPVECAEVEARCPEVLTLQLPEPAEKIPQLLRHVWALDRGKSTAEDARRTALYRSDLERESFRQESMSLRDFLDGPAEDSTM